MRLFDTHAHLDFPQFEADRAALVRRLEDGDIVAGTRIEIVGVLIPGIDAISCQRAIAMATLSNLFHVAVAIHPNHTVGTTENDWQIITDLARRDDVVAIGETGLDRYWDDAPLEIQFDWLHRHIDLSLQTNKPILIHCRDAWAELLPILRQTKGLRGVIHAFSGTAEQMQECVKLGFFISFAGSVTYRNAKFSPLWEAARQTPADRLLIETDAPFMTPHPLRGRVPRNEPMLAALTALRLAELRNVPVQTIAETTTQNALQLFFRSARIAHCRESLSILNKVVRE